MDWAGGHGHMMMPTYCVFLRKSVSPAVKESIWIGSAVPNVSGYMNRSNEPLVPVLWGGMP